MDLPARRQSDLAAAACRLARADVDQLLAESRSRASLTRDLLDDLQRRDRDLTRPGASPS